MERIYCFYSGCKSEDVSYASVKSELDEKIVSLGSCPEHYFTLFQPMSLAIGDAVEKTHAVVDGVVVKK